MIQFSQVCKNFTGVELFKNISLFLPKASYTFIGGSEGSGKTTLLQMIMAYEKPSSGTLTVDNMDIASLPDARVPFLRRQIGLVETSPLMLENRTVAENITIPMQIAGFDKEALQERVTISLEETGLGTITDVPVQQLDQNQRRLVALARATAHRPQILLVDAPAEDLRDSTALTQWDLLQDAFNNGATVVVTENESGLAKLIDRLPNGGTALVINNGKIDPYEHIAYTTRE